MSATYRIELRKMERERDQVQATVVLDFEEGRSTYRFESACADMTCALRLLEMWCRSERESIVERVAERAL